MGIFSPLDSQVGEFPHSQTDHQSRKTMYASNIQHSLLDRRGGLVPPRELARAWINGVSVREVFPSLGATEALPSLSKRKREGPECPYPYACPCTTCRQRRQMIKSSPASDEIFVYMRFGYSVYESLLLYYQAREHLSLSSKSATLSDSFDAETDFVSREREDAANYAVQRQVDDWGTSSCKHVAKEGLTSQSEERGSTLDKSCMII